MAPCSCAKRKGKYVVELPNGNRSTFGTAIEAQAAIQATGGKLVESPATA
jgi:uncharacterized membrane protein (UPF0127 family)